MNATGLLAIMLFSALSPESNEFRWHPQRMKALQSAPIIRQMKVPRATRDSMMDALVHSLRANTSLTEDAMILDLAMNEGYEFVDLDGDGVPELITQAFGIELCGAVGNCVLQVFRKHGSRYDLVLYSRAESLMVDHSGQRPLLVLYTHGSATEGELGVYAFSRYAYAKLEHNFAVSWRERKGKRLAVPVLEPADQ